MRLKGENRVKILKIKYRKEKELFADTYIKDTKTPYFIVELNTDELRYLLNRRKENDKPKEDRE